MLKRVAARVAEGYRDATGLHLVELSHNEVAEARKRLGVARIRSSEVRAKVADARSEVQAVRSQAESIDRIDPRFPALIQKEHEALKTAADVERHASECEELEKIEFERLSSALELSHAQERDYAERTKWYSVISSAAGAVLGLLGSSLVARSRNQSVERLADFQSQKVLSILDPSLRRLESDIRSLTKGGSQNENRRASEDGEDGNTAELGGESSPSEPYSEDPDLTIALEELEHRVRELQFIIGGTTALLMSVTIIMSLNGGR
uniref:Coiled-coil domain-containing protein 51 n=1 Tax=Rhodosorus marinus TaxID=101924 RepID=A0A7S3A051_9RHOD|mmetsp:Transcript_38213/g.151310  ORF Transcript_38213/g.151310 Transcript_38213/m.151310 type:complete len:265 (+) Transcript_38213:325-1119(+)|eukprot:CAMPEP_0113961036 /NCGR_PEP_ID=MMETSP0011_2-20120614/5069_1 /TAXON_ID=101924 /ORGANISM="Rhodosorus marinus" /LENGTH=264 /DNA_ID=CAMNT_0000972599 /DNA_START=122 /DNA_END=916 /DNA_ORIENTATION=- /assembly_acc=CAM_ASM_000156